MEKIAIKSFGVSSGSQVYHGFRKAFIKNNNISLEARFLLILLFTYKGNNSSCWPSQGTLSKIINRSRRTVSKYLQELASSGYLKISSRGYGRSLLYYPNYLPVQKEKTKPDKTVTQEPTQVITARTIVSGNIDNDTIKIRREYVN